MRLIELFPGQGFSRQFLLAVGLFFIGAGVLLVAAASQTTVVVADRALSRYWRTTYDILVRPAGSRSPIEEKYGLVEANHLSGIWGGITFEQYNSIKAIPGVEIAAPIAMLGYLTGVAPNEEMRFPPYPGVYRLDEMTTLDDGARTYTVPGFPMRHYYYFDRNPQELTFDDFKLSRRIENLNVNLPKDTINGGVFFPLLIAGIDPAQEAALIGLNRTIVKGRYLRGDESLNPQYEIGEIIDPELFNPAPQVLESAINLSVLVNTTNYVSVTNHAELKRVVLPPDVTTVEDILARGGTDYLDSLPIETLTVTQVDSRRLYQQMIESLTSRNIILMGWAALSNPSALVYRESTPPFLYQGLVLAIEEPHLGQDGWPQYRASGKAEFNALFWWDVKGVFDIEGLSRPADVNRAPLETYLPPVAILRYDEQGRPVDPPRELRPTLNLAGYIQPPPLLLTTLEAARALRGEAAISAIRVRVGGIDQLTPQAQRKIEAIAIEIQRQTGLDVDIMVGSSPRRILVHVPGIGYVEEQWIQKGVSLVYKQGIQAGNWLLLGTLLVAGGLFALDLTWAEVVARCRLIALQKALGWRSRTVFAQVLGQVLSIGTAVTLAGSLGALGVMWLLGWQRPPYWLLLGLPLAMLGDSALGSLLPAWLAARTPPLVGLRQGGLHYRRTGSRAVLGVWGYAWSGLMRRAGRTLLAGLTAVLSAGLLVLLVAVLLEQRGMLSGTLLGEFLLVRIQGFHYAIVGIGFGLAALSTANNLLAGVLERRREIGVLKAMGWRTGAVMGLFVLEGVLLGLAGGTMGALLGGLAFVYLYRAVAPGLALAVLVGVGVPGLIGALAALYPARVAARVAPAEAMRYE